jgi:MFS family permease
VRLTAGAGPARVFFAMLAGIVVMPGVRPLFASRGASESWMHAFMSVNMFAAALATPFVVMAVDRSGRKAEWLERLAVADAALMLACAAPIPLSLCLALRGLQGVANVATLSLTMAGSGREDESARAARGAAMMGALVAGPFLGAAFLEISPRGPFSCAALSAIVVASLARVAQSSVRSGARAVATGAGAVAALRASPMLRVPTVVAFAERFNVGVFVVTFAVRAHGVLGLSDRQISLGYSLFLVPFAVGVYPAAMLCRRVGAATQLASGALLYAASFASLGLVAGSGLAFVLVLAGVSSALMYAPALSYAARFSPEAAPSSGMALFHAAGCLGMALGPAVAGIVSATLRRSGTSDETRYAVVFATGAAAMLLSLLFVRARIAALRDAESPLPPTPSSDVEPTGWAPLTPSTFPPRPSRRP